MSGLVSEYTRTKCLTLGYVALAACILCKENLEATEKILKRLEASNSPGEEPDEGYDAQERREESKKKVREAVGRKLQKLLRSLRAE